MRREMNEYDMMIMKQLDGIWLAGQLLGIHKGDPSSIKPIYLFIFLNYFSELFMHDLHSFIKLKKVVENIIKAHQPPP